MFQQMKNIDTAFRQVRTFCIALMTLCAMICAFTVYKSYEVTKASQNRIYVLANGKALEAYSSDRKDNIPVEAKDHIKMFHQYFFTLAPDDKMIQSTITRALYLADETAKRQYDILRETGYFSSVISGNISQEVAVDSISVDISNYPYRFTYYGKQRVIRATSIVTRALITEGYLRNVVRSDNNPHGFLIEKWVTKDNRDITIQNR
jgi:conjugative transposon TraK protein